MTQTSDDPMPVFVIKGKDRLALETIREYESLCWAEGLNDQAREVQKALQEILDWQRRHPDLVKAPDHKHVAAGEAS